MTTKKDFLAKSGKDLGVLAFQFRGTRDFQERVVIAYLYAQAVKRLIASKKWKEAPPPEDQLPHEWMPKEYFQHWKLQVPGDRPSTIPATVGSMEEKAQGFIRRLRNASREGNVIEAAYWHTMTDGYVQAMHDAGMPVKALFKELKHAHRD